MKEAEGIIRMDRNYVRTLEMLFLPLLICSLSLLACGRRGDPVLVQPPEAERAVEKKVRQEKREKEPRPPQEDSAAAKQEEWVGPPDTPKGLRALYTGKSIVLTWEEVLDQGVRSYLIYRSAGDEYMLRGETTSPAFTDRDIVQGVTYYYKVEAAGKSKSPLSEEIRVTTEIQ